jgi:hypothetical protein
MLNKFDLVRLVISTSGVIAILLLSSSKPVSLDESNANIVKATQGWIK